MATVIEFERASTPINAGDAVTVGSSSTLIAPARDRKNLVLGNGSDETIWIRLSDDGAVVAEGIPIFANSGLILKQYAGAVCGICTSGGKSLGRAEF